MRQPVCGFAVFREGDKDTVHFGGCDAAPHPDFGLQRDGGEPCQAVKLMQDAFDLGMLNPETTEVCARCLASAADVSVAYVNALFVHYYAYMVNMGFIPVCLDPGEHPMYGVYTWWEHYFVLSKHFGPRGPPSADVFEEVCACACAYSLHLTPLQMQQAMKDASLGGRIAARNQFLNLKFPDTCKKQ
jgi:hypothetical protein